MRDWSLPPDLICFVDRDGYYVGERDTIVNQVIAPGSEDASNDQADGGNDPGDACSCVDCQIHAGSLCDDDDEDDDGEPENAYGGLLVGMVDGTPCLIHADNQQMLWHVLSALADAYKKDMQHPMSDRSLVCHTLCGEIVIYAQYDDIPRMSTLCACGHEWVVCYRQAV